MSYEDYSQEEVDHIITTLLEEHADKLNGTEMVFLVEHRGLKVTQQQRDIIIGMYDRMGGSSY